MKKIFTLSTILFLAICLSTQAAEQKGKGASEKASEKVLGVHPWLESSSLPQKTAHWSISVEAGFNYFHGDQSQLSNTLVPWSIWRPTGGITFEYDFTPVLGLSLGYQYANYGVKRSVDDWLFYGHLHSAEALFVVDLTDAWFPRRRNTVFNLYVFAGGGAGYYQSTLNDGINPVVTTNDFGKLPIIGFGTVGGLIDFNLSRGVSLGLRAEYHINATDYLENYAFGASKDNMTYASLSLRWKINARHQNHVRNFSPRGLEELQRKQENNGQEGGLGSGTGVRDTVVVVNNDTIFLSKEHERVIERQRVEINNNAGLSGLVDNNRFYCYFASGKDNLNDNALQQIQQVATLLQEDDKLGVAITGYCDNTASAQLNEALSKRRAKRVANELVRSYNIDPGRIVNMGLGILHDANTKYAPNRRVEMKLIVKSDLQKLSHQKDSLENVYNNTVQTRLPKIGDVKYIVKGGGDVKHPVIETTDTVIERTVETYAPKGHSTQVKGTVLPSSKKTTKTTKNGGVLAKVTVDGTTTLVKLAKEYYGKGEYWPIIYEANKNSITSPNRLKKGMVVIVPELTAEQKKMSKAQLEKLAEKYL